MYLKFNRIRESCSYYYVYETKQKNLCNLSARQTERKREIERVRAGTNERESESERDREFLFFVHHIAIFLLSF